MAHAAIFLSTETHRQGGDIFQKLFLYQLPIIVEKRIERDIAAWLYSNPFSCQHSLGLMKKKKLSNLNSDLKVECIYG